MRLVVVLDRDGVEAGKRGQEFFVSEAEDPAMIKFSELFEGWRAIGFPHVD